VRSHFLKRPPSSWMADRRRSDHDKCRVAPSCVREAIRSARQSGGAGSSSGSGGGSLPRKIRSSDNCDLSSRGGNPPEPRRGARLKAGGRASRVERRNSDETTTCPHTANLHLLRGALETNCVNPRSIN